MAKVEIISEGIEDGIQLRCDHGQLSQILLNLMNNAFDAVEKSQEKKWVKIIVEGSVNFDILKIVDSGKGISKEKEKNIFDSY